VPQHVQVIDAVCPGGHPRHQAADLQPGVRAARPPDAHLLAGQGEQARALGQAHHRDQARARHEIRVIEPRRDLQRIMRQSHLSGVLSNWALEAW